MIALNDVQHDDEPRRLRPTLASSDRRGHVLGTGSDDSKRSAAPSIDAKPKTMGIRSARW
jgi:hypothetical protein